MIYTASRTHHAPMWLRFRDVDRFPILSTWINEYIPASSPDIADLWIRCVREASDCKALVLYVQSGDMPLKGGFVEVGAALAMQRPVFLVCPDDTIGLIGSWVNHPLVTRCCHVEDAMVFASKVGMR